MLTNLIISFVDSIVSFELNSLSSLELINLFGEFMRKSLLLLCFFGFFAVAKAESPGQLSANSAFRFPSESFTEAYQRYLLRLNATTGTIQQGSVLKSAVPFEQLNFRNVTQWPNIESAVTAFKKVRDTRFISAPTPNSETMMRRSSWLFPDDGCFARAALAGQNLQKWGAPRPSKVFIFGSLNVKTKNHPNGSVSWWYHVVPIVIVKQQALVLDPAIEPTQPIPLKDWILKMTSDLSKVKLSLCHPTAYGPNSPCLASSNDDGAIRDQMNYLRFEWNRLVEMKRDPLLELGDSPPWPKDFTKLNFSAVIPAHNL